MFVVPLCIHMVESFLVLLNSQRPENVIPLLSRCLLARRVLAGSAWLSAACNWLFYVISLAYIS